jgi:hypothetical protein
MPHFTLWTPEEDKLLGTAIDSKIAKRLGRTPAGVLQRWLRLSIPAFGEVSRLRRSKWGPTEIDYPPFLCSRVSESIGSDGFALLAADG